MQIGIEGTTGTSSNQLMAVESRVSSQEWRVDFARIYAARESCASGQAERAASILCESLCMFPPVDAVGVLVADGDLLAALRIATREASEDSRSGDPAAMDSPAAAHRA